MLGPRLGAQRTQNNGQKIHVFCNHRRMHSSPFSPQGSRPGARARARARRRAAGPLTLGVGAPIHNEKRGAAKIAARGRYS